MGLGTFKDPEANSGPDTWLTVLEWGASESGGGVGVLEGAPRRSRALSKAPSQGRVWGRLIWAGLSLSQRGMQAGCGGAGTVMGESGRGTDMEGGQDVEDRPRQGPEWCRHG